MKISDMDNAAKAIRILRSVQFELKKIKCLEIKEPPNDIFNMANKITVDGYEDGFVPNQLYLSGVYVTNEIKNLTIEVLEDHEIELMDYLESIGVLVYGENKSF